MATHHVQAIFRFRSRGSRCGARVAKTCIRGVKATPPPTSSGSAANLPTLLRGADSTVPSGVPTYLLYRMLEAHADFGDGWQERPHLLYWRRRPVQDSDSPPRHREVHLPRPTHATFRELVQSLPPTAPQRIQILPNTRLYPDLPCLEGGLGGHPVSRLFDRDVFTLSQVPPPWTDL